MRLTLILTKFKSLLPVLVVGGAVAITIKLLTQQNTPNSQLLSVEAEEDIAKTEHKEELEEEQEEEVPPEEEESQDTPEDSSEDSDPEEQDEKSEVEGDGGGDSENEKEETEAKKEEKKEESAGGRKFGEGVVPDLLKSILDLK